MITTVIIAGLAIWQIIKIWEFSELFADRRARAEAGTGFFSRLLQCPFCLSNWVAAFVVCTIATSEVLSAMNFNIGGVLAAVPAQIFAAARVANLCNDFFKMWDRTPRYTVSLPESEMDVVEIDDAEDAAANQAISALQAEVTQPDTIEPDPTAPFDQILKHRFQQAIFESFVRHHELRSVVVVFDYHNELNESQAVKGLWLGPTGEIRDYPAIIGSFRQTMAMAGTQFQRTALLQRQVDRELFERLMAIKKHSLDEYQENKVDPTT